MVEQKGPTRHLLFKFLANVCNLIDSLLDKLHWIGQLVFYVNWHTNASLPIMRIKFSVHVWLSNLTANYFSIVYLESFGWKPNVKDMSDSNHIIFRYSCPGSNHLNLLVWWGIFFILKHGKNIADFKCTSEHIKSYE